jgi:hypothetical protein
MPSNSTTSRIRDRLPISHGRMAVRKCRNRHRLPVCARVNPPDGGRQPQKPGVAHQVMKKRSRAERPTHRLCELAFELCAAQWAKPFDIFVTHTIMRSTSGSSSPQNLSASARLPRCCSKVLEAWHVLASAKTIPSPMLAAGSKRKSFHLLSGMSFWT